VVGFKLLAVVIVQVLIAQPEAQEALE